MTASKVVERLQELIQKHGDLELFAMVGYDYWSGNFEIDFVLKEHCTCLDADQIDHFEII